MYASQLLFIGAWSIVSSALILQRDAIPLSVPLSGDVSNTSVNFNPTTWTLWNPVFNQTTWEAQPYVANGYIGHRIPAEGMGYWQASDESVNTGNGSNGWPLFDPRFASAMIAQFYDQQPTTAGTNFAQTGGEQPISTLPAWTSLYVTINNVTFLPYVSDGVSEYSQNLSIRDGIVSTSMVWNGVKLNYTVLAHRTIPTLGIVRLEIEPVESAVDVVITDMLDGAGSWRTTFINSSGDVDINELITQVQPDGITNVTGVECSVLDIRFANGTVPDMGKVSGYNVTTNSSTVSQGYSFTLSDPAIITKYVGIASTDAFPDPLSQAKISSSDAFEKGWDILVVEHRAGWEALWTSADIEVPDNEEVQLMARSALFHLWSNIRSGTEPPGLGDSSIAPAGLTSDSYAGQIFWDADTFMFPGLLVLSPDYAQSIINYREKNLGAALQNAKQYNLTGALYPWTGARFGNCTGVGPCYQYEYHINNDIALAQWQYYLATGNQTWLQIHGYPVISAVADMWVSNTVKVPDNSSGGYTYQTFNLTDPDEFANNKDNGAYTNAGIKVVMAAAIQAAEILGLNASVEWFDVGDNLEVPVAPSGITLEYRGFNGTVAVKQADVVLLTYPLEYPQKQPLLSLDFYSIHTSANGPAMTYSNFAIDAAELSTQGCASWSYLLAGSAPYLRLPFYQFSEETVDFYTLNGGTNPAYTFLTGHGGLLQVFTHGFTGYRFRSDVFYLDPSLPPQLGPAGIIVRGMKWQGAVFDIQVALEKTTITRLPGSSWSNDRNVTIQIAADNPMAGIYFLAVQDTLVVSTRRPDLNVTVVQGNLAQCKPVIATNSSSFPGQYPVAAVDSSNGTAWQPSLPNASYIVVDLEEQQMLSGVHINWGEIPAQSFEIAISNDSMVFTTVATVDVEISVPYNVTEAALVEIVLGNTTDLQFSVVGRYVQLIINGTYGDQTVGATVAEFAVL